MYTFTVVNNTEEIFTFYNVPLCVGCSYLPLCAYTVISLYASVLHSFTNTIKEKEAETLFFARTGDTSS